MKKNVVLITIDSLRADVINKKNTPKLIELIKRYNGSIFNNAFTAGMPTYYSFPSILGSIYPLSNGYSIGVPKNIPLISEILQSNSYSTFGFSAGNMYTSAFAGYNRGFSYFQDYSKAKTNGKLKEKLKHFLKDIEVAYKLAKKGRNLINDVIKRYKIAFSDYYPVPNAKTVLDDAFTKVRKEGNHFFLWSHLMDVHEPYLTSKNSLEYKERLHRSNLEMKRNKIWNKLITFLRESEKMSTEERIHYFVEEMKKIKSHNSFLEKLYLTALKETEKSIVNYVERILDIFPNTIFIITSDHGEEFFDNETYGHFPLFHNDSVNKIPLIFINHRFTDNVEKGAVSTLDIAPTICELLNIEIPVKWQGESLLKSGEIDDRIIFTESIFGCVPRKVYGPLNIDNGVPLITAYVKQKKPTTIVGKNVIGPLGSYESYESVKAAFDHFKEIAVRSNLKKKIREIRINKS